MNLKINELRIANEYFNKAVIEIDDKEMFNENIKELLRYLHSSDFSINDVLEFYSFSDLQDEYDISRLMDYLHVTDNLKENNSNEYQIDRILAHNECGYLVLVSDKEED
ncbi:hypothetical protein [Staphylococcus shinii]|uniref:hypothetical protein n=1 Tax=Staphylococcus shinii TaxID=2912228 RepID=UPI003F546C43